MLHLYDFPGGNVAQLYQSIQKILSLPDETNLYMCHDYMPNGRELKWQTTVLEQKQENIHTHQGINKKDQVRMRTERDKALSVSKLILPALQVNMRAGRLPNKAEPGNQFLKIPFSISE